MFDDLNGDRFRGSDEPGLDGWVVYVDLDDDGVRDGLEPFATTAGGGFYTIEGILPGTYKVREELQPAWRQTAPAAAYHEVHFLPGSAITSLDFGNQACPADWLLSAGDTLYIFGDAQDNQVNVSVDHTGRLTVTGDSDCFYEFTGIRRIVAEMEGGNDQVSLFAPVTGMIEPIDVELRTDQGDDQVLFENWRGNVTVDLGDGDDTGRPALRRRRHPRSWRTRRSTFSAGWAMTQSTPSRRASAKLISRRTWATATTSSR